MKRNMKKVISILLVLTMVFALSACGKDDNQPSTEGNKSQETSKNAEGKTKLTLASFVLMPYIEEKITEFNDTNPDYYIEVLDYSQYDTKDDYSAGETKLNTDIIGGNTPDIIELGKTPIETYTNKGLLEDLNNFLDNDEALSKDGLVQGVYNALSTGDHLYRIAPSFTVTTLYGRDSKIGDKSSWNVQQLKEFLNKNEAIDVPFINMPPSHILHSLTMYSMDQFANMKTGECSFDSEEFVTLLEMVKTYSNNKSGEYKEANQELLSDKGLLATMYMTGVNGFVKNHNELNNDMKLIGFPTESGSGNIADFQFSFGVFADSQNKEGAWAFLKTFLEEDYQDSLAEFEIPVLLTSYKKALDKSEATEEQKDEYNTIISSITKTSFYDETLMDIIVEESRDFFDGQRSAQEAADAIQSRAKIYISESR